MLLLNVCANPEILQFHPDHPGPQKITIGFIKYHLYNTKTGEIVWKKELTRDSPSCNSRRLMNQFANDVQALSGKFLTVTDGPEWLRQYLHPLAAKFGRTLPQCLHHFVDLRKCFRKSIPHTPLYFNFEDILEHLRLRSTGDKLLDMAKVEQKLLEDFKCDFNNLMEMISSRLLTRACGHEIVEEDTCVRVRGIPWQCSDHDLAKFFRGLNIPSGGVSLVLNQNGRRSGEALIRFENSEHRNLALQRHRQHMGNRYIEVFKAPSIDFIQMNAGTLPQVERFLGQGSAAIARMRGLPFSATKQDILEFLCDIHIVNGKDGIFLIKTAEGKPTGDAFVLLASEDDAVQALGRHKANLRDRYVEVFRSTGAELHQVLTRAMAAPIIPPGSHTFMMAQPQQFIPSSPPMIPDDEVRNCVRLRGMPYSATLEDIMNFLGESSQFILPAGVHMVLNQQGRPSGDAFIQLQAPEFASRVALDVNKGGCHKKHMGERYVEVFQCSGDEMNLVLMGGTLNRNGVQAPPGMTLIPTDFAMQQQAMLYAHAPMMMPVAHNAFMPTADVTRQRAVYPYSPFHGVFPTPPMSPTSTPLPPNYLQMPPGLKMESSPGNHQNSQEYHSPPKFSK